MSKALREYTNSLFEHARPTSLNLIIQTFHCEQCRRVYRTPGDEPMVQLQSPQAAHITRHVRLSKYPFAVPHNLPRRIIEVESHIEYCEACFLRTDDRQGELFVPTSNVIPLPFNGKPILVEKGKPTPPKPLASLDDF